MHVLNKIANGASVEWPHVCRALRFHLGSLAFGALLVAAMYAAAAPSYCCQKRLLFSRKLCLSQWRGSKWRVEGHENYDAVSRLFCLGAVHKLCRLKIGDF